MGRDRNDSLDGLRAFAAISVLLFHCGVPMFAFGAQGVPIFFVLSGFLITSLLAAEMRRDGKIDVAAFIARRLRRLVPALLVVVAVTAALTPVFLPDWTPLNATSAVLAATYLMNVGVILGMPWTPLGHTWTLALEMQFYLLWPFIVSLVTRVRWPAALLLGIWLATVLIGHLFETRLSNAILLQINGVGCLVLGSAIAFLPPAPSLACRWGGIALIASMFLVGELGEAIRALPTVQVGAALLISGLRRPSLLARALSIRPLAHLGLISYGVYLWHAPISRCFESFGWRIATPLVLLFSVCLASLSFFTIERWAIRAAPAAA